MQKTLTTKFSAWSLKRNGVQSGPVRLTQRRIYIIPTRHGILFGMTMALLLVGSINYGLGLGFVLTFLLVSMGLVTILHTWRNIANLLIFNNKTNSVFAGEHATFVLAIQNVSKLHRYAIGLVPYENSLTEFANVAPRETAHLTLRVPAPTRGVLKSPRFTLFTEYPIGLLHAWAHVFLDAQCIVYPRPEALSPALPRSANAAGNSSLAERGRDDFAHLRNYRSGDSPKHVAWKAVARSDTLLTKEFSGEAGGDVWLDFDSIVGLDTEAKLSRLTRWVLDADEAQMRYGLRLPHTTIPLANGGTQRAQCLEALALFGHDE